MANNHNHSGPHPDKIYDNILQTIGNTPLVRINRIAKEHGVECDIWSVKSHGGYTYSMKETKYPKRLHYIVSGYANRVCKNVKTPKVVKCEYMNPGGSVKDRIGYTMIRDAEKKGRARIGTRFIEPTSGNTGIGVALTATIGGYGCTIVTPDKNSDEKMSTMRLLGAEVIQTPAMAPYGSPKNFASVAKKLLEEDPNAISLDQYDNEINPLTHYNYTAEEILDALDDDLDMVVIGAGTGGTLSGIAKKMKERCPKCIIVAVDPLGSIMFQDGQPKLFYVEGIGGDFIPKVLDKSLADKVVTPNDYDSFNMSRELIKKEGLLCGGSSGAAMFSAIQAIKEADLGAGKRVVVILPDGIRNYMSKFVCDQWMEAHLFKEPPEHDFMWWNRSISNLDVCRDVPRILEDCTVKDAIDAMGTEHSVAIVLGFNKFLKGVISKKSIRSDATNPNHKGDELDMSDPVSSHLIKFCQRIVENRGNPTVGLAARILDIAPFVLIVEEFKIDKNLSHFIPKGIVTDEILLDFIVKHQNNL